MDTPAANDEFPGSILQMLPLVPHSDVPVPSAVHLFAFPTGFRPSNNEMEPALHSFVQTDETSRLRYGTVLTFYERNQRKSWRCKKCTSIRSDFESGYLQCKTCGAEKPPSDARLFPKALVLTSYWPFAEQFGQFLVKLLGGVLDQNLEMPIERIVMNLIMETPLPPSGQLAVHCHAFRGSPIVLDRLAPNQLDCSGFAELFGLLSLDSVIHMIAAMMGERKVLLVAQQASQLFHVGRALHNLLFPFSWQNPYIPLLPAALIDFIYAPVSYMFGVLSSYSIEPEMMEEVVCIDWELSLSSVVSKLRPILIDVFMFPVRL